MSSRLRRIEILRRSEILRPYRDPPEGFRHLRRTHVQVYAGIVRPRASCAPSTRYTASAFGVGAALNPHWGIVRVAPRRWSPDGLLKGAEPVHLWLDKAEPGQGPGSLVGVSRPGIRRHPAFLTWAQGPGEERCWRADTPGCCSCSWDCSCYGTSSACGPCPRQLYTVRDKSGKSAPLVE